jgi:hypothetical protein
VTFFQVTGPHEGAIIKELFADQAGRASTSVLRLLSAYAARPTDAQEGQQFVPTLIALSARVQTRIGVLNGLGERYSEADVARLALQARAKLQRRLNLHFAGLNDDLIALDGRLAVLAGASTCAY